MINTEEFNEDKEDQALIDFFNELEEKDNVSTKKKSIEPIEALTPSKKKPKRIWEEEKIPVEWKEGIIIKLPKKGDFNGLNTEIKDSCRNGAE